MILLYACPVWIKAINNVKCRRELESVQKLMANKMIKGFKTISYEAAIALSGLQPIIYKAHQRCLSFVAQNPDTFVQATATTETIKELLNIYEIDMLQYEKQVQPALQINPSRVSEIPIVIEEKELAKSNPFLSDKSITRIFTDGSKKQEGTGCASVIYLPQQSEESVILTRLQNDNSIYQAELFAILLSLAHIHSQGLKGEIHIFSDSRSSLEKLKSQRHKCHLLMQIQKLYHQFSDSKITLHWCPGHEQIDGNEKADYYAKLAIHSTNVTKVPLPISSLKARCRQVSKKLWDIRWKGSESASVTKKFFPNMSYVDPKFTSCHEMTQLITGHSRLNYDLQRHGLKESSLCSCGNVESVEHFLFWCPRYTKLRRPMIKRCNILMIAWPPSLNELVENPLVFDSLFKYLKYTKRLSFE